MEAEIVLSAKTIKCVDARSCTTMENMFAFKSDFLHNEDNEKRNDVKKKITLLPSAENTPPRKQKMSQKISKLGAYNPPIEIRKVNNN